MLRSKITNNQWNNVVGLNLYNYSIDSGINYIVILLCVKEIMTLQIAPFLAQHKQVKFWCYTNCKMN